MIFIQLSQQLLSLSELLSKLDDRAYNRSIKHLGNASIGGHTRHIVELLQCAVLGYVNGFVDYENRERNIELECNIDAAQHQIQLLLSEIKKEDRALKITNRMVNSEEITTTYFREVLYNTEHVIHHLALIKVALIDMDLDLADKNFGMAYSTIKYKNELINS